MTNHAARVTREFHEGTKLGGGPDSGSLLMPAGFTPMDMENRPTAFKRYPDAPRVGLPRDVGQSEANAAAVLSGEVAGANGALTPNLLARVLFYSAGVTRVRSRDGEVVNWFRAAPAAGNLHPVEVYVACGELGELPAGIHHFAPGDFGLETVRTGDRRAALARALADDAPLSSPVSLILTGLPWSTGWKYTTRGFRHIYWDAGSMLAQTLAVADAAGVPARVHVGFVDSLITEELGLDGITEFPVAVVTLGHTSATAPRDEPTHLVAGRAAPSSANPVEFPELTLTQRAGDLPDPAAVEEWRMAASGLGRATGERNPPAGTVSLPGGVEELVRRRGSTRMFRPGEITQETAQWCLGVAARPVPGDFVAAGRTLLSHFVSVHSVAGVASGRRRWEGDTMSVLAEVEPDAARAEAKRLCLGQDLGGDSALTVFHCAGLDELFATLGDRGYRAAQLEAGLAAGRLQLAAFAAGLGGTGLTFFDDAVSDTFQTADACMLVTAVGASDYRNRPGGLPGEPTELSGFSESVVERFKARYRE
ncbi:MAG TPA: SagB family peptide dehydrogenase [Acidimicrobiales bacterium]|nr:SagB family peptide dehydrogenase [Acidimicrobiales bacterium]